MTPGPHEHGRAEAVLCNVLGRPLTDASYDYVRVYKADELALLTAALRAERVAGEQAGMEKACAWLEERARTFHVEARASIKRAQGQMTQYAESLTREAEICERYASCWRIQLAEAQQALREQARRGEQGGT